MNIKNEKGITGIDLTIAVIVVMLFVSLITTLYINIYNSSMTTKRKTTANSYINEIFTEIKKADFAKITTKQEAIDTGKDELIEYLNSVITHQNMTFYRTGDIPEDKPYKVELNVEKYNETEGNEWKKDLIRIVTIKVHYRIGKQDEEVSSKIVKSEQGEVKDSLGIRPKIKDGMIPVKYVKTENDGYWQVTSTGDSEWFDYSNKQWANVMLSDNMEMDENGKVTKLGSMFVYIPRYAYRITSLKHSYSSSQGGNIDIKFIDVNNNVLQGENIKIYTEADGSSISDTAYVLNPAFDIGETKLEGIWISKFEVSNLNCDTTAISGTLNYSELVTLAKNKIQSKPNVTSWRNISISNAYKVAKNMMNIDYKYYGIENNDNIESHLIKNTEWGAVAYLAESDYGKKGKVEINKSTDFMTGAMYSSNSGVNTSTTGNIYGIYDMAGGAYDMVCGYVKNSYQTEISDIVNGEEEYKNEYEVSRGDTSLENYNNTNSIYGDAIWETSQGNSSNQAWYGNISIFPYGQTNTLVRGGINTNNYSGIYAFEGVTGVASNNKSFRVSITVK